MLTFAYWTHDLSPFVPFLQFSETLGVRWYGVAYVLGFIGAFWLLQRYTRTGRSQLNSEQNGDLLLVIIIGVMLGGRLGSFLLYHPEQLLGDPLSFFKVWEGGMASHGAFIGVTVALFWFARKTTISFLHIGDLITSTAALGLMLGRIANFINGELWGHAATVPWAVIFPQSAEFGQQLVPRHPSQFYQALLEGAVLFAYMQHRVWKNRVIQTHPGQLSGEFLIGYSIMRVIGEVFREPDRDVTLLFGLSRGTFYSIFILIAGVALMIFARKRKPRYERRGVK